jgi:hypothetical protein
MSARSLVTAFLGAPLAWITHLLASYFVVALACEIGWEGGSEAVLGLTVVFAAAAVAVGLRAYRQWRTLEAERSPGLLLGGQGARDLLLSGGVALAALFTVAIVLQGISPLLAPLCE